tara:strand:- start:17139 stop:18209 length:1071 start_codon:yes stop_codon:yes gene_type:complete
MKLRLRKSFTPVPVFIDGISRAGKAAVAVAVSSLKRTEHVQNRFIFDTIMNYYSMGYLEKLAAIDQLIQEVDFSLYYNHLGRNLNTNIHDWSSVLNSRDPQMYKERMLRKDTSQTALEIFEEIESNKSITVNCCEELLLNKEIFLKAFENLKVVIVLRHPVDIIFSWHRTKRGERYGRDKRFVHQTYGDDECPIPGYALNWFEEYKKISPLERVIKTISDLYIKYFEEKDNLGDNEQTKFHWVYFENFTCDPLTQLKEISEFIGTEFSEKTIEMCLNQRLPREINYNDFNSKFHAIKQHSSSKYFNIFLKCCEIYEKRSNSIFRIKDIPKDFRVKKYADFSEYLKEPDFYKGKRIN